jgi:ribose transport system substrate-binding protein
MSSAGLAGTWNAQGQEAALYWAEQLGVEIVWFDGEFDPVAQRAKFDQIATETWDFVAVQPNTIGGLVEPVQAIIDAGTPLIGMDTLIAPLADLEAMGALAFIAPSNVFMSVSVMNVVAAKMGGAGKISHIGGQPGHTGAQARGQGFLNVVAQYPDIEVVDDQPGDWNVETAAQLTEAVLNRNPDLTGLFADNDDMALAGRQVIENAGLGDQVFVIHRAAFTAGRLCLERMQRALAWRPPARTCHSSSWQTVPRSRATLTPTRTSPTSHGNS